MPARLPRTAACAAWAVLSTFGGACGGAADPARWTEAQARSVAVVRGLEVEVRSCDGLGEPQLTRGGRLYDRFACLAGTRIAGQPVDTVAVTYVLRPLGPYAGPSSPHELIDVSFGGLGVP
jgi:hypothetical protein